MRVLVHESSRTPLTTVTDILQAHPHVEVVAVARTGHDAVRALSRGPIDVSIHSPDTVELSRFVQSVLPHDVSCRMTRIVSTPSPSVSTMVKAHLFGFNGVIPSTWSGDNLVSALGDIVSRRRTLADHPAISSLGLDSGVLTRQLSYSTDAEAGVGDLVGLGLADHDIARIMDLPVQSVRNLIDKILLDNHLGCRTHLAVIDAVHWCTPDLA